MRWVTVLPDAGLREMYLTLAATVLGTPDEMCEQFEARRERLGISYVNRGADMMATVVARRAGR